MPYTFKCILHIILKNYIVQLKCNTFKYLNVHLKWKQRMRVWEGQLKPQRTVGRWPRARCCHKQLLPNAGTENVMTHAKDSSTRSVFHLPFIWFNIMYFLCAWSCSFLDLNGYDIIAQLHKPMPLTHTVKPTRIYPTGSKGNAICRTIFFPLHAHAQQPSAQRWISAYRV